MAPLRSIHVVELEEVVVEAVRAVNSARVLEDPRLELEYNDARNTLLVGERRYDIIASQPSHPWLSGVGNVFTRRFFEIVHSRLEDGGIYPQWVNLFNMDSSTLKSILRAYFDVFARLRHGAYRDGRPPAVRLH